MTVYKIIETSVAGTAITLKVRAKEGERTNISGCINCPCPEWVINLLNNNRPIRSEIEAKRIAGMLLTKRMMQCGKKIITVGGEIPLNLFGQESHKDFKKRLKKEGKWMEKDDKFKFKLKLKTYGDKETEPAYFEKRKLIQELKDSQGAVIVKRIDKFDTDSKELIIFRNDKIDTEEMVEAICKLPFVTDVTNAEKEKVT